MPKQPEPLDPDVAAALEVDAAILLDHSMNGFFLADRHGHLIQCNQACLDILGIGSEEFLGQSLHDFDIVRPREEISAIIDATAHDGYLQGDSTIRGPGGRAVDITFSMTFHPEPGEGFFTAFFLDITEQKRAERALRESEARWRTLAEGVNAAMFIYQEGRLVYANKGTCRITGYDREELSGMPLSRLMHADYRALYQESVDELKRNGMGATQYRGPLVTRDGTERWVSMSLAESTFGDAAAILGVAFDITEQVKMGGVLHETRRDREALAREMARVEIEERRAVGSLLHDGLVQDLAACRLQVSQLRDGDRTPDDRALAQTAIDLLDSAIRQSRNLIRDLSLPILHEFGIDAALRELSKTIRDEQGLDVQFESVGEACGLTEEIRDLAFRAVRELLRNTAKHAEASHATIRIVHGGENLRVTVTDDGSGFDPATIRRTSYEPSQGFGLFFLTRRIWRIGGRLEIRSSEDSGSSIEMTLPLRFSREVKKNIPGEIRQS